MNMTESFPETYAESRERFCSAVDALGAERICLPLDVQGMPGLSIDVALIGNPELPAVVVSSGLHGVEAPFGAAVQLAWLAALLAKTTSARYIFLHALNPYGYAVGRRTNEGNIDLNRNFLQSYSEPLLKPYSESAQQSHSKPTIDDYGRFDGLLNPSYPPERFNLFMLKAMGYLAREGRQRLQSAIVTGQYAYPQGLFYGGLAKSQTVEIIEEYMPAWVGESPEICHLDFHTGLGAFGRCQLMIQADYDSTNYKWSENAFGPDELVATARESLTENEAYHANGAMGDWLMQRFSDRPYRFVTAEFGTFSALKILNALRTENQAFHYCEPDSIARVEARKKLEECFCPLSPPWRHSVLARGVRLIDQAAAALHGQL